MLFSSLPTGVTAAVVALCATAALAVACGLVGGDGAGDEDKTTTPSVTQQPAVPPEEALRLFVQRRLNQGFVADCDAAQRPDDVAKQCARLLGERSGLLAYELGPTFAEYTRLIILKQVGDTWTIEHLENRDPNLPPVPGIPWPLEVGVAVVVAGTGDCLRVRERAGIQAPEIACLDDGAAVTVSSGPVEIDGFEWWQLEGYGWAAGNWLRYPEEAPASPTETPEG
ncbi:MAG: hypothetical protein A2148_09920 [Chloroflexi bacterium RBG_16_68_14]|nr:MAG: hypothetical protein A2148_09920 [Chloroflexi bacterium RBG_16_68_14]